MPFLIPALVALVSDFGIVWLDRWLVDHNNSAQASFVDEEDHCR